jgi:hypothetical protein
MRDAKRIRRMLRKLEKVWINNPDQRLGQLVDNLSRYPAVKGTRGGAPSVFYVEDDKVEASIDHVIQNGFPERTP